MLKTMREGSAYFIKGVMLVIVITFIGTIFVVWGVKSTPGDLASRGVVATVAGTDISMQEYQQALQRQIESYKQVFGDKLDDKLISALNVKRQVLEGLVRQLLILHYAADQGIGVSPEELADHIRSIPVFQSKEGFSRARYLNVLRANRLSPEQFEAEMRQELIVQKVEALVEGAVKVSDPELRDAFDRVERRLTVQVVELPTDESGKKLADAITVAMGKGKSLGDAATEAGVSVERYGPFPAAVPPKEIPDPDAFRQAVNALKMNETSPLVTGQKSMYLIHLIGQEAPPEAEFLKDKEAFRAQYLQVKRQALMADWLSQLRQETKVTVDAQNL